MVVMSAQDRKAGTRDAKAAALLRSLVAFSGKYSVHDSELTAIVDVSWNEAWNGSEQRAFLPWRLSNAGSRARGNVRAGRHPNPVTRADKLHAGNHCSIATA